MQCKLSSNDTVNNVYLKNSKKKTKKGTGSSCTLETCGAPRPTIIESVMPVKWLIEYLVLLDISGHLSK